MIGMCLLFRWMCYGEVVSVPLGGWRGWGDKANWSGGEHWNCRLRGSLGLGTVNIYTQRHVWRERERERVSYITDKEKQRQRQERWCEEGRVVWSWTRSIGQASYQEAMRTAIGVWSLLVYVCTWWLCHLLFLSKAKASCVGARGTVE